MDESDSFKAPTPKHFCTEQAEQDPEPAVAEDIAEVAKRRSTLTEREKYNFFYHHYTPDVDFKFPRESQEASGMNTLKDTSNWHTVKSKMVDMVSLVYCLLVIQMLKKAKEHLLRQHL